MPPGCLLSFGLTGEESDLHENGGDRKWKLTGAGVHGVTGGTVAGNVKCSGHCRRRFGGASKSPAELPHHPATPLRVIHPLKKGKQELTVCAHVHSSSRHSGQRVETAQVSSGTDRDDVGCASSSASKKQQHDDTWVSLKNKLSQRSQTPKATLYDSIYEECPEQANAHRQTNRWTDSRCAASAGLGERRLDRLPKVDGASSRGDENALDQDALCMTL